MDEVAPDLEPQVEGNVELNLDPGEGEDDPMFDALLSLNKLILNVHVTWRGGGREGGG